LKAARMLQSGWEYGGRFHKRKTKRGYEGSS
jgi:hypothetical protein